jgi:hypothetical protein
MYGDDYVGDYIAQNLGILQSEENWNERMTGEVADLFQKKYGCIFEDGDINVIDEKEYEYECAYNYYNFMTDKFWDLYKEDIKKHRIHEGATIFYDFEKMPAYTQKEYNSNRAKYKFLKAFNPDKLIERGPINYDILSKLGNLIVDFKDFASKKLFAIKGIKPEHLYDPKNCELEGMTEEIATQLEAYKIVADNIYDEMMKETNQIYKRKALIDNIKSFRHSFKSKDKKTTPRRVLKQRSIEDIVSSDAKVNEFAEYLQRKLQEEGFDTDEFEEENNTITEQSSKIDKRVLPNHELVNFSEFER